MKDRKFITPVRLPKNLLIDFAPPKFKADRIIEEYHKHMTKKERFPFELDLEGARKIINCACEDWKAKLSIAWAKPVLLGNNILILESFYREMRKACNDEQHKVLDEVFGKDEKSVYDKIGEFIDIETGSSLDSGVISEIQNRILETFDIKFKE